MPNFNSTLYTRLDVNKYLGDPRDRGGRVVPIPFEWTTTTEVNADTVNLCVLPANCEVLALRAITDGLGTSVTLAIGDSGAAARYAVAVSLAAAEASIDKLAFAGQRYRPTTDTIVVGTIGGASPTAGKTVKGYFLVVPGA